MNHKIGCLIVCLALFGMSEQVTSQTYIIPEVGINMHTFKYYGFLPKYEHLTYDKIDNLVLDFGTGLKIKHQISSKWSINLNGNYCLIRQSYNFHTYGFFSYRFFKYYQMASLDGSVSYKILKNFELGAGYKNVLLFKRSISLDMANPESEPNVNINSYLLCLGYNYNNFVIDLSYSNSIKKSDSIGIEIFSLNVGYRIKLFDSFKRGQKVNCPKF